MFIWRMPVQSDQREFSERTRIDSPSTVRNPYDVPLQVQVVDLSRGGCRIETNDTLDVGSRVEVGLPGYGSVAARVVRADAGGYGCEFFEQLKPAAIAQAFSRDVVVAFPTSVRRIVDLDIAEETPRSPGAVRTAIILGGAAASWTGVYLLTRLAAG